MINSDIKYKLLAAALLSACAGWVLAGKEGGRSGQEEIEVFLMRAVAGDLNAVRSMSKGKEAMFSALLVDALNEARNSEPAEMALTHIGRLRRSLASLGHSGAREEIIQDLSSSDLYAREGAFEDAEKVGGDDMIFAVGEKLFDPSPGGIPVDFHGNMVMDVRVLPARHHAVLALSRMIPESEAPLARSIGTDDDVEIWQRWWLSNKGRYIK